MFAAAENTFMPTYEDPNFLELQITLNVIPEDEHEPYIEWFNCMFKERCCISFTTLPFKKYHVAWSLNWHTYKYFS